MKTNQSVISKTSNGVSAGIVIIICFILAVCFFHFVLGNPSNFMDNNPDNHPLPGNYAGTIYKGGFIVPVVITLLLTVITLSVERFIAINRSKGKKALLGFVRTIKKDLEDGNLDAAQKACKEQQGSVANVVNAALTRYADVENRADQTKRWSSYRKRSKRARHWNYRLWNRTCRLLLQSRHWELCSGCLEPYWV